MSDRITIGGRSNRRSFVLKGLPRYRLGLLARSYGKTLGLGELPETTALVIWAVREEIDLGSVSPQHLRHRLEHPKHTEADF